MARGRIPMRDVTVMANDRMNFVDKELAKETKSRIYTTEIVEKIIDDYNNGVENVDLTPFFHGRLEYRNPNLIYKITNWELEELQHCQEDIIYYAETYGVFKTDKGYIHVKLRDYQRELLSVLSKEEYDEEKQMFIPTQKDAILLWARQCSKTTSCCLFISWYILFSAPSGANVSIIANKESQAIEILEKMMSVIERLPFWMKPGIISLAKNMVRTDRNVTVRARSSSRTSSTGASNNLIVWDEASKLPAAQQELVWASIYPTLSSSSIARCIVMSTPDGRHNRFYKIWDDAINGRNTFYPSKVEYWRVPGHDDPKWIEREKKNMGERIFRIEYELNFDEGDQKIVSGTDLNFFNRIKKKFVSKDIYGVPKRVSDKILWDPNFPADSLTDYDLSRMRFLLQIDTAQGKKMQDMENDATVDWNVINIYLIEFMSPCRIMKNRLGYKEIKMTDVIRFRQIGIYLDQSFNEEYSAEAAKHIVFTIFRNGTGSAYGTEIDNCRILLEINFNGVNWIKQFKKHDLFYSSLLIKTFHSLKATKKDFGFKTVGGAHGKGYWCEQGALMIQKRQIIVCQDDEYSSKSTLKQLASFGKNDRGGYGGMACHDDIAVTVFFVSIVMESEDFAMWIEDWFRLLPTLDIPYELKVLHEKISRLMNIYVEQEYDDDQYSVNDIKSLYGNAGSGFGQLSKTYDPYSHQSQSPQRPMMPGSGFSSSPSYPSPGFPSNPGFGQYSQGSRYNNNSFGPNPFQR